MTRDLLISRLAEDDLREIWTYGFEHFGARQADLYLDLLGEGMRACQCFPEVARDRTDLRVGYRSLLVRRHMLYFTVEAGRIVVQRILHGSQDPELHLE